MSQEIKAVCQELKFLEAREAEVTEAMAVSSKTLDFAKCQIKKAREIIAKANFLLFKAEPESQAETIRLEEITAERIHIQQSVADKRTTLDELKYRSEMTAAFNQEELKPQGRRGEKE